MQNDFELRQQAKQLFDDGRFTESYEIYKKIYQPNCDKWIGWEYASALKKLNMLDEAIVVSKEVFTYNKDFYYNSNLLSWLVYEKYYKQFKEQYDYNEINNLLQIAFSVTEFSTHNSKSAYEKVVFKMIKVLKSSPNVKYDEILKLINKLDVTLLSNTAGTFDQHGKEKEYQSAKEAYYAIKTKALFETKNFGECIKCCDDFAKDIKHSHHDNSAWILARKANSLSKLGNVTEAIIIQNDVILKKQHWSLFDELAKMHLLNNDRNSALLYFCRAALTPDPPKMKVGLYIDIAKLLIQRNDREMALLHLIFAKKIRENEEWKITNELAEILETYSHADTYKDISLYELKAFWLKMIYNISGKEYGKISRINANGKTGFIQSENDSYFFKTSSFVNKTVPKVGMKVLFTLVDSFDIKKNSKTLECAHIQFDKNKK